MNTVNDGSNYIMKILMQPCLEAKGDLLCKVVPLKI